MDAIAQELAVDFLFDFDQVPAQGVLHESDALLFDAAAPARRFVGEADHVRRDAVEAGDVGGLKVPRFDQLSVLWVERQGFYFSAAGENGRDVGVTQAGVTGHP